MHARLQALRQSCGAKLYLSTLAVPDVEGSRGRADAPALLIVIKWCLMVMIGKCMLTNIAERSFFGLLLFLSPINADNRSYSRQRIGSRKNLLIGYARL